MRSSRRNLGLQPELVPDDSSSEENETGSQDRPAQGDADQPAIDSIASEDVNLEDSEMSKSDTSDEEDDVAIVAATS